METIRELTGFADHRGGSRIGGESSKIPAGTAVDRLGPPVRGRRLIFAAGLYCWAPQGSLRPSGDSVQ